ncbi:ATP-dependent Clp protease ATP-binding subunit [Nocardia panacis]|uniref:ATP-dependent Clp protease ATP-binding subunit n=1 Tax=Nocardia panacis TaxID=2340916 RepID=A0A3A4KL29_9NOCA|nr:AAA family ATPase [Nocardia panacis]RJO77562.1 ATP-dependent Clp protease ATP-binding subunit [Nocardia panacis]
MPYLTDMLHDQNRAKAADPVGFDRERPAARLGAAILGQPEAIDAVVRAITLAHVGAADPERPLTSILLVGPTGVGKTELVRQVAAVLRSGPEDLCRIDMNALAQEHYAASFTGAPPGYAGSKESLSLFDKGVIEGDPYTPGIVLFDEIEKADATVVRALLHVLDTGELRLANGKERISFRNSYVFLTSNLGSVALAREQRSLRGRLRRASAGRTADRAVVHRAVEDYFDPEFYNRIDEIVVLNRFDEPTAHSVARLEIERLAVRLERQGVRLDCDASVSDLLVRTGFDPVYGARGLRRGLRRLLAEPVAEAILRQRVPGEPLVLHAEIRDGRTVVR